MTITVIYLVAATITYFWMITHKDIIYLVASKEWDEENMKLLEKHEFIIFLISSLFWPYLLFTLLTTKK